MMRALPYHGLYKVSVENIPDPPLSRQVLPIVVRLVAGLLSRSCWRARKARTTDEK